MRATPLTALLVAAALVGCANTEGETPTACLDGARDYLGALDAAPGQVRLDRETPISACLRRGQGAGDLNNVGASLLGAANRLNRSARRNPGGVETVRLGYLIGAVQRGASTTSGIHADLVRRLDSAARYNDRRPFGLRFERAFGRGYAAGRSRG